MKLMLLVAAVAVLTGCAAKKAPALWRDDAAGADDVRIEEDAPVRRLCIQWFVTPPEGGAREWHWRCIQMDELRALVFPESAQ
jgi:hypothetical protein